MSEPLKEVFAEFGFEVDGQILVQLDGMVNGLIGAIDRLAAAVVDLAGVMDPGAIRPMDDALESLGEGADDAGTALTEVGDDAEKAKDGAGELAGALEGVVTKLVGVAALHAAFEWLSDVAGETEQMSRRFALSTDEVATFRTAARATGAELDDFGDVLGNLGEKFSEAITDRGGQTAKMFRDLGIQVPRSTRDLPRSGDQLRMFADALARIENPAERAALASQLLGDAGIRLLPFLSEGAAGIDRMAERTRKLGGGFSGKGAESLLAFQRALGEVQTVLESLAVRVIDRVSAAFDDMGIDLAEVAETIFEVVDHGRILEVLFGTLAAAATAFGLKAAAAWAIANAPLVAAIAGVLLLIAVIEDLWVGMEGGQSVIFEWVDSLLGVGSARAIVEGVRLEFALLWETIKLVAQAVTDTFSKIAAGDFGSLLEATPEMEQRLAAIQRAAQEGAVRIQMAGAVQQSNNDRIAAARAAEVNQTNNLAVNVSGAAQDPRAIADQVTRRMRELLDERDRDIVEAGEEGGA
jgi:hypothetical protein